MDDFMHSVESGIFEYLGKSVFFGLTEKKAEKAEVCMRSVLGGLRSSVCENYPRWRIVEGFSKQTLMTATERVGSCLALAILLKFPKIATLFEAAHKKQRE
eukprot:4224743-Ditylum_brightwellii.AAC.1